MLSQQDYILNVCFHSSTNAYMCMQCVAESENIFQGTRSHTNSLMNLTLHFRIIRMVSPPKLFLLSSNSNEIQGHFPLRYKKFMTNRKEGSSHTIPNVLVSTIKCIAPACIVEHFTFNFRPAFSIHIQRKSNKKKSKISYIQLCFSGVLCAYGELKYYYCVLYMCVVLLVCFSCCILFRVGYSYDSCQFSFVFAFRWFDSVQSELQMRSVKNVFFYSSAYS